MSHILQLTILRYPEIQGGVDAMVVNLVTHLKQRHQVSVFVPGNWDQKRLSCREVDGVPVYSIRLRMPFGSRRPVAAFFGWLLEFPRTLLTLRRLVREKKVDLIHAHVGKDYQVYLRVLHWLGGPPYLITLHRGDVVDFPSLSKPSQWFLRFALRGAARVNAVSRWLARDAERLFPNLSPVTWIYNGLELPDPRILCAAPATPGADPVPRRYAIMVGSFDQYKGHDIAFRAWDQLPQSLGELHLLVVGDGELRSQYVALIAQLECKKRILLLGQITHKDVLRLMHGALAMVFPSRSEGFAYALLEAGAVGIPVLCTDIPAFTEIITDGINGLIVPADNPTALAAAVAHLACDPQLCARLGQQLQQQIHTRFTAEVMTREYEKLYTICLEGTRR